MKHRRLSTACCSSTLLGALLLVGLGCPVDRTREQADAGAAGKTDDPPPLPLFAESRTLLTLGNSESAHEASVHLSVNDGGLEANLVHYQREARARGWQTDGKPGSSRVGPGHHMLLYRKASRELTLDLSIISGKRVRVHMLEVGS